MKYYLRILGKAFGPFDEQQLLDLKDKGKLSQTSELSPNKSQWSPAGAFDFLFTPSEVAPEPAKTYAPAEVVQSTVAPTRIAPPPPPPSGGPAEWYYSTDGASGYGPVDAGEVVRQIQSEVLNAESLVWKDGQSARPIHAVSAFARYVTPQSVQPMQPSAMSQIAQPRQQQPAMPQSGKSKAVAGILGIIPPLGFLGAHKFYMGSWGWGLLFLVNPLMILPLTGVLSVMTFGLLSPLMLIAALLLPLQGICGIVEGIMYLIMSDENFAAKYPPETQRAFRW